MSLRPAGLEGRWRGSAVDGGRRGLLGEWVRRGRACERGLLGRGTKAPSLGRVPASLLCRLDCGTHLAEHHATDTGWPWALRKSPHTAAAAVAATVASAQAGSQPLPAWRSATTARVGCPLVPSGVATVIVPTFR